MRGSALAALKGTDDKIGKEAILALMEKARGARGAGRKRGEAVGAADVR